MYNSDILAVSRASVLEEHGYLVLNGVIIKSKIFDQFNKFV